MTNHYQTRFFRRRNLGLDEDVVGDWRWLKVDVKLKLKLKAEAKGPH